MELYVKTNKQTGQLIKSVRKANKISQAEFSKQLGVTQGTLSRIERGFSMFIEYTSLSKTMKWAQSLGQLL